MSGFGMVRRGGALLLVASLLTGCGGSAATFRETIPAEHRYKVEAVLAPGKSVAFPTEVPLNVHDKLSAQTPGTDGQARGDATAEPTGRAECKADADKGGSAWGQFQLGHCVDNRTEATLRTEIEFSVEFEVSADCAVTTRPDTVAEAGAGTAGPLAVVSLMAVIRDSNERVLETMSLANETNDLGRIHKNGAESARFSIEMEPGLAYTIALVGEARITTTDNSQASASVNVKNLKITVTGRS